MGKSLKNAVSPEEMYEAYGSDTLRLYEMATGPLDASRPWETRDVVGMYRFLQRLWRNVVDEATGEVSVGDVRADETTRRLLHRTIDGVRSEIEALRFNTAIAKLIELNNHLTKIAAAGRSREVAEPMVLMVAPFVPHVAEELWRGSATTERSPTSRSPTADPALLVDGHRRVPGAGQRQGPRPDHRRRRRRPRRRSRPPRSPTRKVVAALDGATPKKVIVVPGRMVNVVV